MGLIVRVVKAGSAVRVYCARFQAMVAAESSIAPTGDALLVSPLAVIEREARLGCSGSFPTDYATLTAKTPWVRPSMAQGIVWHGRFW